MTPEKKFKKGMIYMSRRKTCIKGVNNDLFAVCFRKPLDFRKNFSSICVGSSNSNKHAPCSVTEGEKKEVKVPEF